MTRRRSNSRGQPRTPLFEVTKKWEAGDRRKLGKNVRRSLAAFYEELLRAYPKISGPWDLYKITEQYREELIALFEPPFGPDLFGFSPPYTPEVTAARRARQRLFYECFTEERIVTIIEFTDERLYAGAGTMHDLNHGLDAHTRAWTHHQTVHKTGLQFDDYDHVPPNEEWPQESVLFWDAIKAQSPHRSKNGQLAERRTNMSQNSVAMTSSWATG